MYIISKIPNFNTIGAKIIKLKKEAKKREYNDRPDVLNHRK